MRVADKLALIDKIGRALQSRYSYGEIDAFLAEFKIKPPPQGDSGQNSKWVYSKNALKGTPADTILKIAAELDLDPIRIAATTTPPRNWEGTTDLRLFISHISKDKVKATRLKDCLFPHGISAFVAHEDIHPTLEWQSEIERALYTMDAFLAMHTVGFSQSIWTQQEVGFAVGRGIKIISFKMGEDPTGFISKRQALPHRNRMAEEIAEEIATLLADDDRTASALAAARAARKPKRDLAALDDDIPF